jgi:membrane-associated phospholipid phosphatase
MSAFESLIGRRTGPGAHRPSPPLGWSGLLGRRVVRALAAVLVTCAVLVPAEMMLGDRVRDLDRDVAIDAHLFTASERAVRVACQILTFFGSTVWLTIMVGSIALGWLRLGRTRATALLLVTGFGGALVCRAIKVVVDRDRPALVPALADPYGSSFPSGHAMQSVAVYGVLLAIVAPQLAPRARRVASGLVAAFVAGIAISRVMLGVHYVSDITAGVVLGVIWLTVVALLEPSVLEGVRGTGPRPAPRYVDVREANGTGSTVTTDA